MEMYVGSATVAQALNLYYHPVTVQVQWVDSMFLVYKNGWVSPTSHNVRYVTSTSVL